MLNPPAPFGTAAQIERGEGIYSRVCGTCHGQEGLSRGMFPDLRYSSTLHSAPALKAIAIDGALAANGMVSFAGTVGTDDLEAIRAYLVSLAIREKTSQAHRPEDTH